MPSVQLLYSGGYRWWGVSVACSSIELVPSVIRPTLQWWIQMVGVCVACSCVELVPSVDLLYSGGYRRRAREGGGVFSSPFSEIKLPEYR